jgi:hypothetical protein
MISRTEDTLGLEVSHEVLNLIAEVDEFKGRWEALQPPAQASCHASSYRFSHFVN